MLLGVSTIVFLIGVSPLKLASAHAGHHTPTVQQKVLLISFDGFRWDYLQRLPGRSNFSYFTDGVFAPDGIKNVFVTKTFPNHYTLVTGLYEESHDITGNEIYDPVTQKLFNLRNNKAEVDRLFGGEPIWATYVKQRPNKQEPLAIMWVGSIYDIAGVKLKTVVPFSKKMPLKERIDKAVDAFAKGTELVLMYYHEPDHSGHFPGPETPAIEQALLKINDDLGYLIEQLEKHDLTKSVNVIIGSDHGMTAIKEQIPFPENDDLYETKVHMDILYQLMPKPGKTQEAVDYLRSKSEGKYSVFRKEDLPVEYHYANNKHVLPILVVAHQGITLADPDEEPWTPISPEGYTGALPKFGGTHGYNNSIKDMHPTFMARGPAFKSGYTIEEGTFRTLDVYNLVCTILKLNPAPNNGSLPAAHALLTSSVVGRSAYAIGTPASLLIVLATCVAVVLFVLIYVMAYRASNRRQIRYTTNQTGLSDVSIKRAGYSLAPDSDSDFGSEDELFSASESPKRAPPSMSPRGATPGKGAGVATPGKGGVERDRLTPDAVDYGSAGVAASDLGVPPTDVR